MRDFKTLTTAPAQSNVTEPIKENPSQTAGPYVHIGCLPNFVGIKGIYESDLISSGINPDEATITISGRVFDGAGDIGKDLMIESWQADENGNLDNGIWLRTPTDLETGTFKISTKMPGRIGDDAPNIQLWIVARGINLGLHTRIYFDDCDNKNDPVLALIPDERRASLIANKTSDGYHFDIHLQGEQETVFFDV